MPSYGLYAKNDAIKPFQRMLNEKLGLSLKPDGNIGKITQQAIGNYQKSCGIVENDSNGPCYGEVTQAAAFEFIDSKYINDKDFDDAGVSLGVPTAVIKAFATTESKEFGFLDSGFPVILFERHKFYEGLVKSIGSTKADKYAAIYPDICNPNPGGYLGGADEVKRLTRAANIDHDIANASASWGLFQILGSNYQTSGYKCVQDFVDAMKASEGNHLKAFVGFIKGWGALYKATKAKDWASMARYYNGPTYASHNPPYDVQLKDNYTLALKSK